MFLWGKLQRPPNEDGARSKEENFYYSTSAGQIVSDDGSGYVIPSISDLSVEKTEFIPLEFAQNSLKTATKETSDTIESYKTYLNEVKQLYKKNLTDTKAAYENVIHDMKAKALRHVEVQKQMRKQMEDKLNRDLKSSEDIIDEMRDSMATLNGQYQEEVRGLKLKLNNSEKLAEHYLQNFEKLTIQSETRAVLHDVLLQVTEGVMLVNAIESQTESDRKHSELLRYMEEQHEISSERLERMKSAHSQAAEIRQECATVLNEILSELEVAQCKEDRLRLQQLSSTLESACEQASSDKQLSANLLGELQQANDSQRDALVQEVAKLLSENEDAQRRVEVSLCLSLLLGEVVERQCSETAVDQTAALLATLKTSQGTEWSRVLELHNRELDTLRAAHQDEMDALKRGFMLALDQQRAASEKTEVLSCVDSLITLVIARSAAASLNKVNQSVAEPKSLSVESQSVAPAKEEVVSQNTPKPAQDSEMQLSILELQRVNQSLLQTIRDLEAKASPVSAAQPVAVSSPASRRRSSNDELARLRADEKRLLGRQADLLTEAEGLRADLSRLNAEKEVNKTEIKEWTRDFIEAHEGREPDNNDKVAIKDKYQSYKSISLRVKELDAKIGRSAAEAEDTSTQLAEVKAQILKLHQHVEVAMPVAVTVPTTALRVSTVDAEVQTLGHAELQRISSQLPPTESAVSDLEALEDQLYQLRQDYSKLAQESKALATDKMLVSTQLDALIKEKRTDIVKRFEDEIEHLQQSAAELNEVVAGLRADKVKSDTKLEELKGRAETAEMELRDRDKRELQALNPTEEKSVLKGQINKQRDAIILKSKAATAGWDAAANADEKLDIEVQRAYKKGVADEREQHKGDLTSLNASLETKEARITELLVSVGDMERRVLLSDADVTSMKEAMTAMQLEVADTIASLTSMGMGTGSSGGDGEEGMLGPTSQELEAAREALDAAQDELVAVSERCEKLESDLEAARNKNRIYDRLIANNHFAEGAAPSSTVRTTGKVSFSGADLSETILNVKKAILKGTNLWKSNKKDDCFDLYLDCCLETAENLVTAELRGPLLDSVTHGRNQGIQNKPRGSVVLRKALDKFLADSAQANLRKNEEDTVAEQREKKRSSEEAESSQSAAATQDLLSQLTAMDNKFLEQGYTKENNPTNTTDVASPRGTGTSASSLLQRARSAEDMVASLRKQLAAVISATAAQNSSQEKGSSTSLLTTTVKPTTIGADQAEVRKLNRKIKELEMALKSGGGGGGQSGGSAAADQKALQASEKLMQKKLKELEASNKREAKTLEMRAVKAENALSKIQSTYSSVVSERDQLKLENDKLFSISGEVNTLRAKAERCEEIETALNARSAELAVVNDAFKKETALRKKYKNELEDLKGAIRVYARCRPMARYELEKGCKSVVEIKDETSMRVVTTRGEKDFEFDAVFSTSSTQDQVFEDTKRLVESCIDGFNVCLFAYGQTGSGKTFTMTGSPSMPGLTPKAIDELFRLIGERKHLNVRVTTYFVELYNDNLVDLYWVLDNKSSKMSNNEPPKLEIKMDAKKMVFIRNSVIKDVTSSGELMELFNKGNLERHTGATKMNAESSRSHSIFSIMVECYDTTSKRTTTGKLSLVDLAGSERADKTGAGAERLKEAQNINKSLSALGDVIAALSEGEKFIPYRNNKLTQLMQDSLGGNAKTLMFVNFSPADYNADETSTSLMYAARVKKIVNNASKQAESAEVARLKHIIKRLMAGASPAEVEVEEAPAAEEPPVIEDTKVYDGY